MNPLQPASTDSSPSLLMALSDRSSDRLRRLLTTYVMATTAGRVLWNWYQRTRATMTYTVGVPGDDDLFEDVHRWLIGQLPPGRRRAELARFQRRGYDTPLDSSSRVAPTIKLLYDGTATQTVDLEGHRIQVHVERPDRLFGSGEDRPPPSWMADLYRVVFTARTPEARDAVEHLLTRLAAARADDPHRVFVATAWDWRRQPTTPLRSLDSVVLRDGQLEHLVDDLGAFLGAEADYSKLGIPYHRGYLFEGPPGCGKTSAAKVLADHFGLDVYYLPLPVVADDARLVQLLNDVQPRSMLLLEDVDIVHAATTRSDAQQGVTMSGLLNALDGFVTPHGLVTVLTTNRADVLDEALVRPGRVDVTEHMGLADNEQLHRLVRTLLPSMTGLTGVTPQPIAPAAVIEAVKRHLRDEDAAFDAVVEAIVDAGRRQRRQHEDDPRHGLPLR